MFDVSSPKVTTPALLFAALSPGMLVQLPAPLRNITSGKILFTRDTNSTSVYFHALVFLIVYKLLAKQMGLVLTKTDLLVTTGLFIALSPGLLLSLPKGRGATGPAQVLVHTLVFAVVFAFLRKQFPSYY
jgi:hypothetical protein|tara:strand:+ start:164 stop:553 length:390 start_codon:yes stop_codon:yes gene_type:complete